MVWFQKPMMPWARQKANAGPTGATTNPTSDYAGTTTGTDYPTRTAGTDYAGTDTHHNKKKGSKFGKAMSVPIALTWFLALASWFTAVGGLIALTVSCHNGNSFGARATGRTGFLGLLSGLPYTSPYSGCVQVLQFQWFHLALELFVLTLTFLTIIQRLRGFRYAAIGLLAVVTVFMMQDTDLFLGFSTRVYHSDGHNTVWDRSVVTFAGFVGMSVFNLLLIILLGAGRRQDVVRRSVVPADEGAGYGGPGYGGNTYDTAGPGVVRDDRPQVGVTGPGYGRSPEVV